MTVRLGGLGPWAYPIHAHKSVGLGLRKGPLKGTPFRRPCGIRWMRSLARYMNGCPSWTRAVAESHTGYMRYPDIGTMWRARRSI